MPYSISVCLQLSLQLHKCSVLCSRACVITMSLFEFFARQLFSIDRCIIIMNRIQVTRGGVCVHDTCALPTLTLKLLGPAAVVSGSLTVPVA